MTLARSNFARVFAWLSLTLTCAWLSPRALLAEAPRLSVVATYGHARELTCEAVRGDERFVGTLGAGILHARGETLLARLSASEGLPGERVRDCLVHRHVLWVATDAGVARFDDATRRFVTLEHGRFAKLAAEAGRVFAADAHGEIYELRDGAAERRFSAKLTPSAFALSKDGTRLGVGGMRGELVVLDTTHFSARRTLSKTHDMPRAEPIVKLDLRDDHIEVTTIDHALRVEMGTGAAVTTVSALPREEATPRARTMFSAAAERLSRSLPDTAALPCGERISALSVHRGVLYAGSFDDGLCSFDGERFVRVAVDDMLPSPMVNDLSSDGTRLYIATARGLSVLEPDGRLRSFVHSECERNLRGACPWHASVNGVTTDSVTGTPWLSDLGALHSLAFTDGSDDVSFSHVGSARIGSAALTKIAAHAGVVAVGSSDRGVLVRKDKRFVAVDAHAGLADDWVMDLAFDTGGALWVATCTRGISHIDARGAIRTLTTADGLVDDYTLSVNVLSGRLWVGTLSGVSVHDPRTGRVIASFSPKNGLSGAEVHDAVVFDGRVFLATDAGISVIAELPAEPGSTVLGLAPR